MAPKRIYDAVIRHESTGPLIWSHNHGKYFIAKDALTAAEVSGAIAVDEITNHISETKAAIDNELREELKQLGVFGYTKTLHSPYSDRLSAPLEIYFDYTWVCNLMNKKCGLDSFCYAREFLGKQTMEKDIVRSVMKDIADWGVMRVHLAGGEPTSLREDLGNYLQAAYDNGLVTSMSNNGLLMTERMSETILDRDIYSVTFSFDGHTEETYGAVRGAGLFPKAVQGVKTFSKVRERYKAVGTGNTKISIKPTFTPETPKEIFRGLVEMSLDLGAEIVKFGNPERCLYHDKGYYGGIRDAYYRQAQYIHELAQEYKGQITVFGINNPLTGGVPNIGMPGTKGCIGGQELLTVNPDGKLTPCLMHNADLGSIDDFDDLKDAWHRSAKFQEFRDSIVEPKKCGDCDLHSSCRSGSAVRKIVEVGEFNPDKTSGTFAGVADPFCPKDYLKDNPDAKVQTTEVRSPFKRFVPVNVLHSL